MFVEKVRGVRVVREVRVIGLAHLIAIDDCAKDGIKEFLTKILCGFKEISQSDQSNFNVMRSIMVKYSHSPSLEQLFIVWASNVSNLAD